MTQRPIGTISPVFSAIGMNSAGEMRPRSGWSQRSSASKPSSDSGGTRRSELRRSTQTIGWKLSSNWASSRARRMAISSASSVRASMRMLVS